MQPPPTCRCVSLCVFAPSGTAPGVKLISLDVFDSSGETAYVSPILNGMDWAVANRDTYNITAINLSLGGGGYLGEAATVRHVH